MKKNIKSAFSLMEMMVVLLIVAIIAAATAPMVTKKMARNIGSGDSPWVFTGVNGNIAYNLGKADVSAIIGANGYSTDENGPTHPRLVLASGSDANRPALAFADQNGKFSGQINMNKDNGVVALNDSLLGNNSVAIGMNQTTSENVTGVVALGQKVTANANNAIAIGNSSSGYNANSIAIGNTATASEVQTIAIGLNSEASGRGAVAVGVPAKAQNEDAVAIGSTAIAKGSNNIAIGKAITTEKDNSIAIGAESSAKFKNSIAIGNNSHTKWDNSIAIGNGVETTDKNQIVLGGPNDTVYIQGNLRVGKVSYFGVDMSSVEPNLSSIWAKVGSKKGYNGNRTEDGFLLHTNNDDSHLKLSDRRLKNVGKKYTAGLEELKKLDFYHYTFKADKDNTPLVGVMAQDLIKVFPDAVTKGDDGYLRIRLEDMFYAVINAVKELDTKISEIIQNITDINSKIDEQQKVIEEQAQKIEALEKQNIELMEEVQKIEKQIRKIK